MLAYAADRRRIAAPRSAPHAMLAIMVAHIVVIALVMSAKLDLPERIQRTITDTYNVPLPPPPPESLPPEPQSNPRESIKPVPTPFPLPLPNHNPIVPDPTPLPLPGGTNVGSGSLPGPAVDPLPIPDPVRVGPRFATPPGLVRPPYPPSKISSEEEATLKLRLSINAAGRVVSVEPVGQADRAFLEAARRHIIARWRYKPATEDGRAIASSTVITLRFELDS